MQRILVTGATGQIGSELVPALRSRFGGANVIAAGHSRPPDNSLLAAGPFVSLDVCHRDAIEQVVAQHKVDTIFHLAALLSAVAEKKPQRAWEVNMGGLINVLEVARAHGCAVFHPSSIGAFGRDTPKAPTPQVTIQRPDSMYGITKVSGELLCDYYHRRFGLDTRGLRFPGLISYKTPPGGGTTDYAVEIFHAAVRREPYTCFLAQGTRLDLMYMPDAIRAAMELMEAKPSRLTVRNAFNITAMSLTPEELAAEISRHIPGFTMTHAVDPVRQAIADSWPDRLDDSEARSQWGWQPQYDLAKMVADMLKNLAPEG